jgi:hypothetical protein
MAGEVGHVVYAARLVTFLGEKVGSVGFWTGTLFPDIRHLGITSRRQTHTGDLSLDKLVGENDFETGMRVHAWIDETRNKFLEQSNMKELLPWHPFVPHALKLVEDEWLYEHFDDWNLIHRALNKVYEDEIQLVQSKDHIIRWHEILQSYFKKKPDNGSRYKLSMDIGLSKASAEEINSIVDKLKEEPKTKQLTDKFIYYLEDILR